jgi:hypothetical protein
MAVVKAGNKVVEGDAVVLHASAARTANGAGPAVAVELHHTARLTLDVTAASGTGPSMTVTIEHSPDGTTWVAHPNGAFAAATAPGTQRKVLSGLDRFVRAAYALTGTTPSFTFSVAGELV